MSDIKYFIEEPSWFKNLSAKSLVSIKEVKELFSFSSTQNVHKAIRCNSFPKPDVKLQSEFRNIAKIFWHPATLRRENERRKGLAK